MNKRRKASDRLTYGYLAILNLCVAGMFVVVLTPAPAIPQPIESNVAIRRAPAQPKAVVREPIIGTANRVVVPSVGIDTSVRPGAYNTDTHTWSIDHSSAFHADITVPVNNANGTTLIYGHAGWNIFTALPRVSEGAEAYVYTDEGNRFVYTFESNRQVDPSDVSVITAEGPPKLVLQTCSGAFDAYRTLVTFRFREVVHSE